MVAMIGPKADEEVVAKAALLHEEGGKTECVVCRRGGGHFLRADMPGDKPRPGVAIRPGMRALNGAIVKLDGNDQELAEALRKAGYNVA